MSIVALDRVTVIGLLGKKVAVLDDLQALGCVHLEPLADRGGKAFAGATPTARRAFRFLATAPGRRHQVHDSSEFDATAVERRALAIEARLRALLEERRFLLRRIRDLAPWGDFDLPAPAQRLGLRLWFYVVPHYLLSRMPRGGDAWQVVHRDSRFAYLAVLAAEEPRGLPVERTHTGSVPLADLEARLEAADIEEDDLQSERVALSRWVDLFAANIARLEDQSALAAAAAQTQDDDALFVLAGWAPSDCALRLRECVAAHSCALIREPPASDAQPPTLLDNPSLGASGQDLLAIYVTPGYRTWDPSLVLVGSFAAFFGIMLADVGYAFLLAGITAAFWRVLGRSAVGTRFRRLLILLAASAAVFGVVTGSYFGLAPAAGTAGARLQLLDASNTVRMMELAAGVGVLHIALANLVTARRHRGLRRLASFGWLLILLSGTVLYLAHTRGIDGLRQIAVAGLAAGCLLVAGYTGVGHAPLRRVGEGLLALARLPAAFGDVLSYLRLFALAFAGSALAQAFNDLAAKTHGGVAGPGLLLAALILLLGHGMNLALGVAGGFIHGLRLNFIEFFNWSLEAEGRPFRPFRKREVTSSIQ